LAAPLRLIPAILALYAFLLQGLLGAASAGIGAPGLDAPALCRAHTLSEPARDPTRPAPNERCRALDCLVPAALAPPASATLPERLGIKIDVAPILREAGLASRAAPPRRARGPPLLL
jgi:hypothetical protein